VIESCRIPRCGVVAGLARRGKVRLRVRRILRLVEVRHVAADASCGRSVELPTRVARVAVQRGVGAGQRKIRWRPRMVELRTHPVVHAVASFAGGPIQCHVVDPE